MGGYLVARSWRGALLPRARATLDSMALQWQYVTVQGLAIVALVQVAAANHWSGACSAANELGRFLG